LRYAPHIQNFFVADVDRRSRLTRAVSFYNYVRRSGYPYVLRMLGGMCLVCACAMLWAAYR
jgi:hypothetical protein